VRDCAGSVWQLPASLIDLQVSHAAPAACRGTAEAKPEAQGALGAAAGRGFLSRLRCRTAGGDGGAQGALSGCGGTTGFGGSPPPVSGAQ
jgi:hypothetical protein